MRIIRHRLNNRIMSASVVIVLCVLLVGLIPVRDVLAAGMEVSLPYEQTWANDSGKKVDNTFDYRMTAADAKSPMPAESSGGTYDFSITGDKSGKKVLHFAFGKPGYYRYKVTPMTSGLSDRYTYEPQEYDLTIMVVNGDGGLKIGAMTIQDEDLAKYSALEYDAEYSEPQQDDPDDNGGGGPANNGGAAPAGGVVPADGGVAPADGANDGEPGDEIDDNPVPLEPDAGKDYWALLNLILMILTVIIAIADGILYFRDPDDEDEEEEDPEGGTQGGSAGSLSATSTIGRGGTGRPAGSGGSGDPGEDDDAEDDDLEKHGLARILAIIVAIISIIVFFLTEDMRLPMEWVDEYTIWMVILFIIEIILAFRSRKTWDEEDEDDADEENADNAVEEQTG